MFAVGIWSSCSNRGTVGGYFLAGRSMHWIPVGASLFASNIGSGHFIGLAGSGASTGISIAVFEFNAVFVLGLLGWLFLPVYLVSGVLTMPEYLKRRFGGQRMRVYLAALALLMYIFTKISADLYAGGVFIDQSMGISLYPAVIILLFIAALFTIMGGLTAVIWTDFIQTVIMIIGAFYLMIRGFQTVGGFDQLVYHYFNAIPNTTRAYRSTIFLNSVVSNSPDLYGSDADREAVLASPLYNPSGVFSACMLPAPDAMNFFKSITSTDLPWVGAIFGLTVNATWYWCTDQVIVQRCLAARNITHARAGIILCCIIKMLPLWMMVVPGMVARILFVDVVGCGDADICKKLCGKDVGCTDIAYPQLVLQLLPSGAKGLMLAVMVASLVSSLTSIFNSSSTLFTLDIWCRIRPKAGDAEQMIVGRVCVLILVGVGIAWIPIVQLSDALFDYIQSVTGYLAPPICVVYVLGIFWKRTNEIACFVTLLTGLVIGIIRFGWETAYGMAPCGVVPTSVPSPLVTIHYLHFSILLFAISFCTAVSITLTTPPLPDKYTRRLVFSERWQPFDRDIDVPELKIVEETSEDLEEDVISLPWYKKIIYWFCGIEKMKGQQEVVYTSEEAEAYIDELEKQVDINETKTQAIIVNVGMGIVLTITVFIWGFFA